MFVIAENIMKHPVFVRTAKGYTILDKIKSEDV